jgi:hypothetical protein
MSGTGTRVDHATDLRSSIRSVSLGNDAPDILDKQCPCHPDQSLLFSEIGLSMIPKRGLGISLFLGVLRKTAIQTQPKHLQ